MIPEWNLSSFSSLGFASPHPSSVKRALKLFEENCQKFGWIPVPFNREETTQIIAAGIARNENGLSRGWTTKAPDSSPVYNIRGYAGERAIEKFLGIRINRVLNDETTLDEADLELDVESKTSHQCPPSLCVNADQLKDHRVYVLSATFAFDEHSIVYLVGWMPGGRIRTIGERRQHTQKKHWYLKVPYERLSLMSKLKERLYLD